MVLETIILTTNSDIRNNNSLINNNQTYLKLRRLSYRCGTKISKSDSHIRRGFRGVIFYAHHRLRSVMLRHRINYPYEISVGFGFVGLRGAA